MENSMDQHTESFRLARAGGRSLGALIFSSFGALWIALSLHAFHHLTAWTAMALALVTLTLAGLALRLIRSVPKNTAPDPDREREGRRFAWVNAAQGVAIFLAVQVANNLHHPRAAFPMMALVVGLHFFALPRSFRHRSTIVTGASITAGAVLCPMLLHGDTMAGAVTLWAGITLWCSAAWALRSATLLLRGSRKQTRLVLAHP